MICRADPVAPEPPGTTEIHAEIDETGGMRAFGELKWGELSCRVRLGNDDGLRVESLLLRHPLLSVGFLEPGELFRLINRPNGAWNRVSARLYNGAQATGGEKLPDEYGIIVSPARGRFAVFSFFEPDVDFFGVCAFLGGVDYSFELLTTCARPAPHRQPEQWLLENRIMHGKTLLHLLWRLTADLGPIRFSGGTVVSTARFTVPQIAGSASVEVAAPHVSASACLSGGMRDYLTLEGKVASVPLEVSWRLATDTSLPVTGFIEHRVEVETLPLIHIPYRATEESVKTGFGINAGPIGVEGQGEVRLESDRSAREELSVGGELSFGVYFRRMSVAVEGEVTSGSGRPHRWSVSVPVKLETGSLKCSGETALRRDECFLISLSAEVTHGEKKDFQWYIGAETDIPVSGWPDENTHSSTAVGEKPSIEFGYRFGWRVKR